MNGFEILSKLGEGAYSVVHKVRRKEDGCIYALKKVKLLNLSEKEKQNAINEVRILASVKSSFVISYKEAFLDENEQCLCIVMEYADKGDLYQKITQFKKMGVLIEEIDAWRIFIQMAKGLKALHDLKILHRDLKSANIFLFSDGTAKLGDLNVSKVARKGLGYTQTGTPYYASPEVWKDQPYDSKSDVWSLGCVTYEMLSLKPPFRAENMEGLYNKVIKGQYAKLCDKYSNDMSELIKMLLQVQPESRPSCTQILKHPIIQKRIEFFKANITYALDETEEGILLQTIRIPKNLLFLTDKLPGSNYEIAKKAALLPINSQRNKKNISFPSVDLPEINVLKSKKTLAHAPMPLPMDDSKDKEKDKENKKEKSYGNIMDKYNEDKDTSNNNSNNNKGITGDNDIITNDGDRTREDNSIGGNHAKREGLNDRKKSDKLMLQYKDTIEEESASPNINKRIDLKPIQRKKISDEYFINPKLQLQKIQKTKEAASYIQNIQNIYQIYCPTFDPQKMNAKKHHVNNKQKIIEKMYPMYYQKSNLNGDIRNSRGKIIPNRKLSPIKKYIIK